MTTRRWWFGVVLVVVVTAVLRLWMPGSTIRTMDEPNWTGRSEKFRAALISGDLAATVAAPEGSPATRPGITTMWIGTFAIQSLEYVDGQFLRRSHQLVAVVCTLWMVPFMAAARRLLGGRAALIAGGVLAVEPLLVGHSALLHTDALMTMSSGTAVLAALASFEALRREGQVGARGSWWRRPSTAWITLAGVAAAFAVLTKVSAVVVLAPALAAAVVVHLLVRWRAGRRTGPGPEPWTKVLGRLGVVLGTGAVVAVAASMAAWPALWVTPVSAIEATIDSIGLAEQSFPRLFLGAVIRGGDWRYYPVEVYFRLSPWVFLVVIGVVVASLVRLVRRGERLVPRRIAVGLVAATVPYALVISSSEKQYARYLLPLLPMVAVAVAVVVDSWLERPSRRTASLASWGVFTVTAAWTMSLAPYQIAHVSPLVGGQRAAETRIPLGWGEGKEQIGAEYPVPTPCPTYSSGSAWKWGYLERRDCVRVPLGWMIGKAPVPEYVYRYVFNRQRGEEPAALDPYLHQHGSLDFAVTIDGVHYVEVWRLAPPSPP